MQSLEDRALAVLCTAWSLLPDVKYDAFITAIKLEDLGSKHGSYSPDDGTLKLSTRIFWGTTPAEIQMIDIDGEYPPLRYPLCSRALHVCIHEIMHAVGATSGIDASEEWWSLSGWQEADDDPQGTARYWERRPGWPEGRSEYRHRVGCWFAREYSTRSPFEDAADTATHMALGWHDEIAHPNGLAKFAYLRRHVWRETGTKSLAAAAQRWQRRWQLGQEFSRYHAGAVGS